MPAFDLILARQRAEQERWMPETVVIKRKVKTADGAGGFTNLETTIATTKGRMRLTGQNDVEKLIAERLGVVISYSVSLPWGSDVQRGDRLEVNGTLYDVVTVPGRSYATVTRCICAEAS